MEYLKQHEKLFHEWKKARSQYDFVNDGILNESIYWQAKPRIAFLLKEGNDNFQNIAPLQTGIEGYGPNGNSNTFWRYISIWIFAVSEIWNGNDAKVDDLQGIFKPVNSIAYLNVKKNLENRSASEHEDLLGYAINDREYLVRQINLVNPQIIICGGTMYLFKEFSNPKYISDRVYISDNRLIIDYYHPSCRKGYKTYDELRELLLKRSVIEEIKRLQMMTIQGIL